MAERILALLRQDDPVSDDLLPDTGISLEWERLLSPVFIQSEHYGTRSSTVLLMTDKEIYVKERVYSTEGTNDRQYTITR